jgi:hypothetical protein
VTVQLVGLKEFNADMKSASTVCLKETCLHFAGLRKVYYLRKSVAILLKIRAEILRQTQNMLMRKVQAVGGF